MQPVHSSTNKHIPPFHQRQSLFLCAVHAINNVLQREAFTKRDLDVICERLSPNSLTLFNPHRTYGLGNFDVNVITVALQQTGHDIIWYDRRKSLLDNGLDWSKIVGCILNVEKTRWNPIVALFGGRHWVGFKGFPHEGDECLYYDLDSKLSEPVLVARSHAEFVLYMEKRFKEKTNTHLLFVVSKEVCDNTT